MSAPTDNIAAEPESRVSAHPHPKQTNKVSPDIGTEAYAFRSLFARFWNEPSHGCSYRNYCSGARTRRTSKPSQPKTKTQGQHAHRDELICSEPFFSGGAGINPGISMAALTESTVYCCGART